MDDRELQQIIRHDRYYRNRNIADKVTFAILVTVAAVVVVAIIETFILAAIS